MSLTLRTWLRYVVPLTLLSAIALAPIAYVALRSGAAPDLAHARTQLRLGWVLAATAIVCQLWLVAGVAPSVRALAARMPLSQWRALANGLVALARGFVPWLVAIAAIATGALALFVPGLLLLVLLALTGASDSGPPPAPHADSIAIARAHFVPVALLVVSIIALDLAIAYAAQAAIVPALVGKKIVAAKLVPIRTFVRVVALALFALSPLPACALAAAYVKFRKS